MQIRMVAWLALLFQAAQANPPAAGQRGSAPSPEKSAYFAFVDHDYIFTVEVVNPGVPLLNFVSMTDGDDNLAAKQVRLKLDNRTAIGTTFLVDTGDPKQPIVIASLTMHARSSFGVRIQGDFSNARELLGVTIRVGEEDFKLAPLTSLAFENLALKVNRINLGSPDFRDDWRVLNLETMGTRTRISR